MFVLKALVTKIATGNFNMKQAVHFTKMHGAGNDYIYVDASVYNIADPAATAVLWSDRNKGIGSDGLVLIGKAGIANADFSMRIFNADGSEADMCGNASRCIGKYIYEKGLSRKKVIRLQTLSGIKDLCIPFFLAGEEILRTKGGDSNSYKSSDEVNNLRWDDLVPGSDAMAMRDFYRSLIALRKANPFLTKGEIACEVLKDNSIEVTWTQDGKPAAYAVINPGMDKEVTLPEGELHQ